MGKCFMTARSSGADSGNDDEEEDGVWGTVGAPRGSRTEDRDEAPNR